MDSPRLTFQTNMVENWGQAPATFRTCSLGEHLPYFLPYSILSYARMQENILIVLGSQGPPGRARETGALGPPDPSKPTQTIGKRCKTYTKSSLDAPQTPKFSDGPFAQHNKRETATWQVRICFGHRSPFMDHWGLWGNGGNQQPPQPPKKSLEICSNPF